MWAALLLPVVAFLTAVLSGMIGMGGGMLLLAAMFCFMSHGEAIPAHAAVQLVSNSTRTLAFLTHVNWSVTLRFLVGVIPGSVLGVGLLVWLGPPDDAEPYLKMLVGAYILVALFMPTSGAHGRSAGRWWDFPVLGLAAGSAAFTVGAVGPLIAPLFARRGFVKEQLVATKAVCQSLLHLAKIPVFLTVRTYPDLAELSVATLLMAVLVIPGTLIGKRLLRNVSEQSFALLFRIALTIAGLKVLVWDGVLKLVG